MKKRSTKTRDITLQHVTSRTHVSRDVQERGLTLEKVVER